MGKEIYRWQNYDCKSCGSGFRGRVVPIEYLDIYVVADLDFYNYVNLCPLCGKEQETPKK